MSTQDDGLKYWTSLAQLRAARAGDEGEGDEFPSELVMEEMDGPTRRHFLGIMGASMTMASMAGCIRRPTENIMPYARMPEDVLPGVPSHYATAVNIGADVVGLLVESNDGRPTKIEGNNSHTQNNGGTSAMHQAMVLDLYDPARLRAPRHQQAPADWDAVEKAVKAHFGAINKQANGTEKLAFLSETIPSPTYLALAKRIRNRYPGAKWYTYESVSDDNARTGLKALFGRPVRVVHKPGRAYTVLALDSDFLATGPNAPGNTFSWVSQREPTTVGGAPQMSRLYAVEGTFSLTGTCADNRLRMPSHEIEAFTFALAQEIIQVGTRTVTLPHEIRTQATQRSAGLSDEARAFAKAVATDLTTTSPITGLASGLVIAGRRQPPVVHALAAVINHAIANQGMATNYYADHSRPVDDLGDMAGIKALTKDLNDGAVETLVVIGGNPVYTAPGDVGFAAAFKKAKTTICLADYPDETSKLATWAIPKTHFLEAWGDLVSADSTVTIQQPLIAPLHGAWSPIELLARILGDEPKPAKGDYTYALIRKHWMRQPRGQGLGFDRQWNQWLHDGRMSRGLDGPLMSTRLRSEEIQSLLKSAPKKVALSATNLEVIFTADPFVYDGRFSNNSLLLEAPDPISKVSWDNAAVISVATAKALEVENEDRVTLEVGERSVEIVIWVVPGLMDNVVAVTLGDGRNFDSYLPYHDAGTVGFDVNPIRSASAPDFVAGGRITKGNGKYLVANVQDFNRQNPGFEFAKRPHVREATLAGYVADPEFAARGIIEHGPDGAVIPHKSNGKGYVVLHPPEESLNDPPISGADYSKGYQWAMVVDLSKCTGCNACLVACMVENNVPAVGKDQVRRGREMHWMRMDRYFTGDDANPEIVHQPMTCQQCEMAPCENVCPVKATAHSPEGLNDMAYNRCIGTRYCANNCPFKVRRFNFYNYANATSKWSTAWGSEEPVTYQHDKEKNDELLHMAKNPDVSVRFRGVMEKCTYCLQRINRAKRKAKMANNERAAKHAINRLRFACEQACPAGAITSGDMRDASSRVSQMRKHNRHYRLLTELNLRPRTSYLGQVRNPNDALAKQGG